MLGAEIEHLLRVGNPADQRPRKRLITADQRARMQLSRIWRNADDHHYSIESEQPQISVVVVVSGDRIEDQIKSTRLGGCRFGAFYVQEITCTEFASVSLFRTRRAEYPHSGAHRDGDLTAHVAEPAKARYGNPFTGAGAP